MAEVETEIHDSKKYVERLYQDSVSAEKDTLVKLFKDVKSFHSFVDVVFSEENRKYDSIRHLRNCLLFGTFASFCWTVKDLDSSGVIKYSDVIRGYHDMELMSKLFSNPNFAAMFSNIRYHELDSEENKNVYDLEKIFHNPKYDPDASTDLEPFKDYGRFLMFNKLSEFKKAVLPDEFDKINKNDLVEYGFYFSVFILDPRIN